MDGQTDRQTGTSVEVRRGEDGRGGRKGGEKGKGGEGVERGGERWGRKTSPALVPSPCRPVV